MKKLKFFLSLLMLFTFSLGTMWAGVTWTRVTKISELTAGGTFIIGYEATANSGVIIPMANSGSATTSAAGFIYSGSDASSGGTGTINMSSVTTTSDYEVTIVASGTDSIAIKLGDNFLGNANTKNNAKLFTADGSANGTRLSPTIGDNDVVTLKNSNANYHTLQYNSGNPRFAFYGGTQNNLVIYKKNETGPSVTVVDNDTRDPWDEIDFGNVGKSWDESVTFGLDCKKMEAGTMTLTVPSGFSFSTSETTLTKNLSVSAGNNSFSYITIYKDTETAGDIDDELTFTGAGLPSGGVTVPLKMNVKNPVISVTKNSSPITEIDLGTYYAYSFGTTVRDTVHFSGHYLPKYRELLLTGNATTYFEAVGATSNYNHIWSDTEGDLDIDVAIEGRTYHSAGTYYYIDNDPGEGRYKISLTDPWTSSIDPVDVYCEMTLISSNSVRVYTSGTDDGEFSIRVYDNSDKLQEKTISNYDISGYYHDENDIIVVEAEPAVGYEFSSWNLSGVSSDINILSGEDGPQLRFKMNSVKNIVFSANFTQTCTPLAAPEEVSGYPTTEWYMGAYKTIIKWNAVANASGYTLNVHNVADGDVHSRDFDRNQDDMVFEDGTVSCEITGLEGDAEYEYTIMAKGSGSYCAENYTTVNTLNTPDWPTVTLTLIENGDEHEYTYPFNQTYTLPSTSNAGCLGKVLVGWTRWSVATQASDVHFAPGEEFDNPSDVLDPTLRAVYAVDESAWNVATSITAGDKVVISTNTAYIGTMETAGAISSQVFGVTESTYNGDNSKITALADGTAQFVVGGNATDGWTLQRPDDDYYLIIAADKKVNYSLLNDFRWDISFDGNVATVRGHSDYTTYSIQFNSDRFTAYGSSQTPISLYKYTPAYSDYSTTCNGLDNSLNVTFSVPEGAYTEAKNVTLGSLSGTTIYYTLDGSDPSSSATRIEYTAPVALNTSGSFTIKAFAISSTAHSSVTQAAYTISLPLTTMDQIFARAKQVGSTATDVTVTLNNWVVTGVNGSNAYITDGTKGFILYSSGHGFSVNDKLSGTVACKVQLYNGAAEITSLTSSTTGLTRTTDGVVTPVETAITALDSVNSGAPIIVSNVEYDGTYLVDAGDNQIKPYNKLYSGMSFTNGKKYNVTGIYLQFNAIKQIMPRSAADIVEVKESAELEWSAASATAYTVGKSYELPTLTNAKSLAVAYSSTTTSVATIDSESGVVTLVGAGSTTIKATASDAYADNEVSYTLTVTAPSTLLISGTLTKQDYELGDAIDPAGLVATVKYGNNETWDPSDATFEFSQDPIVMGQTTVQAWAHWNAMTSAISESLTARMKYHKVVAATGIEHGSIAIKDGSSTASTGADYWKGKSLKVVATPDSKYELDKIYINGVEQSGVVDNELTFDVPGTDPAGADITVSATFKKLPKAAAGLAWSVSEKEMAYGGSYERFHFPTMTNPNEIPWDDIELSSSDADVAEFGATTHEGSSWTARVTLKKPGTATMTAYFAGNDDYEAATVSYELTIIKGTVKDNQLNWYLGSEYQVAYDTVVYFTQGSHSFLNLSNGSLSLPITYESTDETVAKMTNGLYPDHPVVQGVGETTIRAIFEGNDYYNAKTVEYLLTVEPGDANLAWGAASVDATYGSSVSYPALTNDREVTVVYSSSNESVATINAETGVVTLKGNGTTTITATTNDSRVKVSSASYTLNVSAGIVTTTPSPLALDLGDVLYQDELTQYKQTFHLHIENLKLGEYNQVRIDFEGSDFYAFGIDGDVFVTGYNYDGIIDKDIAIIPSSFGMSYSFAQVGGQRTASIKVTQTGSPVQMPSVIVGTVTMNIVEAYAITATAENGTLTFNGNAAPKVAAPGSTFTLAATPESGYKANGITVQKVSDESDVTADVLAGNVLTMPSYAIKVVAAFVEDTGTALDDLESGEKVVKVLDNGVVYIIRDGARYNLLGEKVK